MATTCPLMSVGFYRINKGSLHTLYSLLVWLTQNSHPFLLFSLEGRSFLLSFLPVGVGAFENKASYGTKHIILHKYNVLSIREV